MIAAQALLSRQRQHPYGFRQLLLIQACEQAKQDKLEELARQLEAAAEVRTWTERVELVRRCKLWGPVWEARSAAAGIANQLDFELPTYAASVSALGLWAGLVALLCCLAAAGWEGVLRAGSCGG